MQHRLRRPRRALALTLLAASLGVAGSQSVWAGTTRVWVNTTFADFNGGEGTAVLVTDRGRLHPGIAVRRRALKDVSHVFSLLEVGGDLYLGTGTRGEIWRLRGARVQKVATLPGAVLVTCLAKGPAGVIYAGTLPEGRVYALSTATGKATQLVRLAAEHVWALSWDARARTLFAATGPKGKLFAISRGGQARLYWDSTETHLLSMARGPGGALYVGTAPKAIVYRVLGPGRVRAIQDFAGTEVRALWGTEQALYAAVNDIKADRSSALRVPPVTHHKGTPLPGGKRPKRALRIPRLGAKKGKGAVFRIDRTGAAVALASVSRGYFTALERLPSGQVLAAEGTRGQVLSILPDRSTAVAYDVKERQVLALAMGGRHRAFGAGDGGALYTAGGAGKRLYTSKAFDAGAVARFGLLQIRATARMTVQSRSGNTAEPGAGWSPWRNATAAGRAGPDGFARMRLRSPAARYVQYRILWPGGSRAEVSEVRLAFTPANRAPQWSSLRVGNVATGKSPVRKPSWLSSASVAAPTTLKIQWKVKDPDGDPLLYRVSYRAVGDVIWRRVGDDPVVTGTSLKWKTDALPDGWYEVRVEASDERANGASRAARRARVSPPVLVDHSKPDLVGLRAAYPRITGLARDRFSRITGVAYSLDGKVWVQMDPADGNWDQEAERFDARMLTRLRPGLYTLLVRAYDAAGNARVERRTLRVR